MTPAVPDPTVEAGAEVEFGGLTHSCTDPECHVPGFVTTLSRTSVEQVEDVERILESHALHPSTRDCFPPEPWRCGCGDEYPSGWTAEMDHRAHLANRLAEHTERAVREALAEFVQWVASNRAYNGSDHKHGQSLYNECLNGVLGTWAEEWTGTAAGRAT